MAEKAERLRFAEWGGGVSPFAVGSKKLGMWLFIVSDSLTFSGLLVGYSYVRIANERWPMPFEFWPTIVLATLMTFCLLSSSLTMALAVRASSLGDRPRVVRFILLTMLGGILFVLLHAKEWAGLIAEGVRLWENPWGVPLFGASFFTLTGLHMLHVISGVIYLGVIALGVSRGRFTHEDVEISGLYWHFVDLVWMFIFPLVYLLSVKMP
ncbi:MAG: cytochrome c oxidase subunit 3 [Blastocatellia bacterium]|nr:cytochrome c oxidase subunit 3 [Blastocatellia bacterium]MCS7158283.1 cytochrome c oxidase subunit 3 [Blastocatellia bacterium]MCX7753121.1 cytochrome c oxidase subunit 3 [Blastocatellia bacterium]MDW8169435.1 cytochrome c oxidase subunit 3 [Acidobacteriota bacterium]MDW8255710.1 cytochrome c oxidase subunit 3 [Acidobacteriota bacterium]